jgi:Fur family iron response transcriptional regulator
VLPALHAPSRISRLVKSAGLRPTRQRLAIGFLLFSGEHRHISADELRNDVQQAGVPLSLATVYNTLNQFADVGLVRRIAVGAGRTYFDTDVGDHQHFYIEEENRIIDIPPCSLRLGTLPAPPPGYRIANVDITIRLSRIHDAAHPASSSCAAASECADCGRRSPAEGEPS